MSSKVSYRTSRKYKCPYCDIKMTRGDLVDHVDKKHDDMIPEDYTAARAVYDFINGKDYGTCMICKTKVYKWNDKVNKYYNLCDNPKCREEVRRIALERHMKVYNKPTLLDDPEQQEKMLANRKISGSYVFTDGGKVTYTGKYEKNALEFMDKVLNIPSKDIQAPGPVLEYEYNGKTHKWITDIYYIPGNLLIEVKDGGSNPNNRSMTSYREKQVAKETMVTKLGTFNYIRLTDNNFAQLLAVFADMKEEALTNESVKATIHINEGYLSKSSLKSNTSIIQKVASGLGDDEQQSLFAGKPVEAYKYSIYFDSISKNGHTAYIQISNPPYFPMRGAISIAVDPALRGTGVSDELIEKAIKEMERRKQVKYLSWICDKDNTHSYELAKRHGFEVDDRGTSDKRYMLIRYIVKPNKSMHEEVGGLPANRPSQSYIIPYGMNNVFDGFAFGSDDIDKVLVPDKDGVIPMIDDVFNETYTTGSKIYCKSISEEGVKSIVENTKMNNLVFAEAVLGRKLKTYEEVFFENSLRVYNEPLEKEICSFIENGVVRLAEEGIEGSNTNVIKVCGNVMIHQSPRGYYATTSAKFYMSSDYYPTYEDLMSSGAVDVMNDIYNRNSGGNSNAEQ